MLKSKFLLALALMHELIQNNWLDLDYVARFTLGWDELRAHALQWPPERAAEDYASSARLLAELPTTTRGDKAMKRVQCTSSWVSSFLTERSRADA